MFSCPDCKADRSRVLPIDPCPGCGAMLVAPESLDVTAERVVAPKDQEVLVSANGVSASVAAGKASVPPIQAIDPEDDPDVFDPNATVVEDSTGAADTLAELIQPSGALPELDDDRPTRIDAPTTMATPTARAPQPRLKKAKPTIPPIVPIVPKVSSKGNPRTAAAPMASATLPSVSPPPGARLDEPTIRTKSPQGQATLRSSVDSRDRDTTDSELSSALVGEPYPQDAAARMFDGRQPSGDTATRVQEIAASTLPGVVAPDTLESSMSMLEQDSQETPTDLQTAPSHEPVEPILLDRKRESPFDTRPPDSGDDDSVDVFTKTVTEGTASAVVEEDDSDDVLTRTSMDSPPLANRPVAALPPHRPPSEVIPTPPPASVVKADKYLPSVIVTPAHGAQTPNHSPMQPLSGQPQSMPVLQAAMPHPPTPIGPPPEFNDTSYPGAALDALSKEERGPKPGAAGQAVWREAHPSARRWATNRRGESKARSPQPLSIAVGLMLAGLGCYLLAVFLPSKAPLTAGAWRFSEATHSAANVNAGLIIALGLVVVVRGALHRPPPPGKNKDFSKLTLALVAIFLGLGAWFAVSVLTASMG